MIGVVWHYWLGLFLVLNCVLAVGALIVGYVVKTQAPKYPKR